MSKLRVFFCIFVHLFCGILCRNAMFDDSMLYDISWAGALRSSQQIDEGSRVTITTKDNEHYHCSLLKLREDLMDDYSPGPGPSPEEMLKPLTTNARCSYRLDTYWTYELCHGAHVRQYHDEKPRSQTLQEFFLGRAKKDKGKDGEKSAKEVVEQKKESVEKEEKKEEEQVLHPKHNFQGREVPYYEVIMDNGTACDLVEGKPRQSRIIYICKPDSHNEIVSVKEIESCVYQLEVLTPLLCASDMYKVREDEVHSIRCHSLKGSPAEPRSYVEHIEESEADRLGFREYQYMPVQGEGPKDLSQSAEHRKIPPQPDQQLTQDFLNGDYCLRGGSSGWWLYEYCHGRHVQQYHQVVLIHFHFVLPSFSINKSELHDSETWSLQHVLLNLHNRINKGKLSFILDSGTLM
ncbi:Hypothetical predicted protein [Paramuricea clavata]|uniref:Endoplasmic reticulum lectin 1 n=1 Tax=Paramuricea clavata TaxID=317549 RepID=A0A6S7H378_PARCT|nr:Hypothetical predicted protein [Paramuricea clavata]